MNIRHAVALVCAGWFLMVPPLQKPNAPLSKWKALAVFKTQALCEANRKATIEEAQNDETGSSAIVVFETLKGEKQFIVLPAACVATEDPRLHPHSIFYRHEPTSP